MQKTDTQSYSINPYYGFKNLNKITFVLMLPYVIETRNANFSDSLIT